VTIAEAINTGEAQLAPTGVEDPRLNAELLLSHVLGRKPLELRLARQAGVPLQSLDRYQRLLHSRAVRRPLQYVTGTQEFMGLTFEVTPAALVPRVDTEILVEAVRTRARELPGEPVIADIGTGTGVIALTLAHHLPHARLYATDCSPAALALARRNADKLGVTARVLFACGDLLAPLRDWRLEGQVHVLAANLPYVPSGTISRLAPEVSRHEPRLALDGGPDGLRLIRRLLAEAPAFLRPDGFVGLEIGYDQAESVRALLTGAHWRDVEVLKDLDGNDRVVTARGATHQ
jgi:release factor glutamine methyltransferase